MPNDTTRQADALTGAPEMPDHPEPRTMKWTALEVAAIRAYGQAMAEHARRVALEEAAQIVTKAHPIYDRDQLGFAIRAAAQTQGGT